MQSSAMPQQAGRRRFATLLALVSALVVVGCQTGAQPSASTGDGGAPADNFRIVFVMHGAPSDSFFSVIKRGADQAAKDMGVTVEYNAPVPLDGPKMAQMIDAQVATKPAGMVVAIYDPDAQGPSIRKAVEANIPIISSNAGIDTYRDFGILTHVGQDEYQAGKGGGARLAELGATHILCVSHGIGVPNLDARCDGLRDGSGQKVTPIEIDPGDPADIQQKVSAAIQADPSIDAVVTLGIGPTPVLEALKARQLLGKVQVATFDLQPDGVEAMKRNQGEIAFAIDQQQYLQGYLPVVYLTQYIRRGLRPPADPVLSGPGFVTSENVGQIEDLVSKGLR